MAVAIRINERGKTRGGKFIRLFGQPRFKFK